MSKVHRAVRNSTVVTKLPYGERFLFVEDVISIQSTPDVRIQVMHNPMAGCGIEDDHFARVRVYPGIFILEGCAQAAVLLYHICVRELQENEVPLLAHSKVHFIKPIEDPKGLVHSVELVKAVSNSALFRGKTSKGSALIMECELALAVRDATEVRRMLLSLTDS